MLLHHLNIVYIQYDGYFKKMDQILASYYWRLGRTDYFNEKNQGKFMLFVMENDCDEEDIGDQFGDDVKSNDCEYINMDQDFPLYPRALNHKRQVAIFDVLQYCFKHSTPPDIVCIFYIHARYSSVVMHKIKIQKKGV